MYQVNRFVARRRRQPSAKKLFKRCKAPVSAVIAKLKAAQPWIATTVSAKLKEVVAERKLKMPQVMMPFRVALTGQAQTPAIDAIAAALKKEVVLERLARAAG